MGISLDETSFWSFYDYVLNQIQGNFELNFQIMSICYLQENKTLSNYIFSFKI